MAGVIEEIIERAILETLINMAKKLLNEGEMSIERIATLCELPLEKVQELASKKTVDDLN